MEQKKGRTAEVIRFAISGGACFLIEQGIFALLNQTLGMGSIAAKTIAFLISAIINYLLCIHWVFEGNKDSGNLAKAGFLITSGIGWLLNVLLMILFAKIWGEDTVLCTVFGREIKIVLMNSCVATVLVMIWNYFTKRAILKSGLLTMLTKKTTGEEEKQ
ncbi:MAG: GtrA family protein [Clostridia bacterium]|nr:GtrA family protein [Clostridia bacterium]